VCGEADADDHGLDDGDAEDVSGGCALHVWNAWRAQVIGEWDGWRGGEMIDSVFVGICIVLKLS
jgi:hypothetical protein